MDSRLTALSANGHSIILRVALGFGIATCRVLHAIHMVIRCALPVALLVGRSRWSWQRRWRRPWRSFPNDIAGPRCLVLGQVIRMDPWLTTVKTHGHSMIFGIAGGRRIAARRVVHAIHVVGWNAAPSQLSRSQVVRYCQTGSSKQELAKQWHLPGSPRDTLGAT